MSDDTGEAALRAQLNEELGFYPANLGEESIAEYWRKDAEYREWYGGYLRQYGLDGTHLVRLLEYESPERVVA